MANDKKLNEILDSCLERMLVEGETVNDCLKSYPERADELKPLLETALTTRKASLAIEPDPRFRAQVKQRFLQAAREAAEKKSRLTFSFFKPRWATAVVSISLAFLLAFSGMVVAAGNSIPGDALYSVKLAMEQVMLAFAFSDEAKAEAYIKLADRRVEEIIYLASKGDSNQIKETTRRLDDNLAMVTALVGDWGTKEANSSLSSGDSQDGIFVGEPAPAERLTTDTELERLLSISASSNNAALAKALQTAPDSVKAALSEAIASSITGYQQAIEALRQALNQ